MRGRCTDAARWYRQSRDRVSRSRISGWGQTICLAWIVGISFATISGSVHAQEPVDRLTTPVRAGATQRSERNLLERMGWVRLEMVGGRIAVLGHRCGQSRVVQVGEPSETPREQFSVQLHDESLVIHYEDVQAERQLKLDLDEQRQLTIVSTGASPTNDLKLVQPFRGPITLTRGREKQQTYSATSLWHFALQQPEMCEEVLFPALETLRPHWRLQVQATAIRQSLLARAGEDVQAQRAEWLKWVKQLDSDDFQERQQADSRLRAAGQAVAAWLRRIDRNTLSAEQESRIRDICRGLADLSTDSPQRVAAWMVDDRSVWLALMGNENAEVRLRASNHLALLCGKPLAFDPNAKPRDREQQLAQLQVRFGKP